MWSTECRHTETSREDSAAKSAGGKVVKEGFKVILLEGSHHCVAVHQLKVEDEQEYTERLMCVIQVFRPGGQVIG